MQVQRVSLFKKYPTFISIHTELRQVALGKPCAYCGKILNKSNLTIDNEITTLRIEYNSLGD